MFKFYLWLVLAVLSVSPVQANVLDAEKLSNQQSYQTAGVYWLPDYFHKDTGRTNEDTGGGDIDRDCETYVNLYTPSTIDRDL